MSVRLQFCQTISALSGFLFWIITKEARRPSTKQVWTWKYSFKYFADQGLRGWICIQEAAWGTSSLSSLWVLLTQKTSLSGGQMPELGNGVLHHYRPPRHINEQPQIIFLLLCVSHWESGTLWEKVLWILFHTILLQNVCVASEVVSELWKQLSKNRPIPWHGRKVLLELWNAGRHFSRNILWALQLFLGNVYMWTETSHYTLQYTQLCLVYCCKANMEFHRP